MASICPSCGLENRDSARFCARCGFSLTSAQAAVQPSDPAADERTVAVRSSPPPAAQPQQTPPPQSPLPQSPQPQPPTVPNAPIYYAPPPPPPFSPSPLPQPVAPPRRRSVLPFVLIGLLLAILLGGAVTYLLVSRGPGAVTPTPGTVVVVPPSAATTAIASTDTQSVQSRIATEVSGTLAALATATPAALPTTVAPAPNNIPTVTPLPTQTPAPTPTALPSPTSPPTATAAPAPQELTSMASASASSTLPTENNPQYGTVAHDAGLVLDHNLVTNWTGNAPQNADVGEWLKLTFPQPVTVSYLRIAIGAERNATVFQDNHRLKTAILTFSDGTTTTASFQDTMGLQDIRLPQSFVTDSITLTITEVYPTRNYDDTPIAEIEVWGNP